MSLVCFSRADDAAAPAARLDGRPVDEIHTDLTARRGGAGVDLTAVRRLPETLAWLAWATRRAAPSTSRAIRRASGCACRPRNPNGRANADVLKPWVNGMDLTRRPASKWIVDFGWTMLAGDAALYEEPFRWAKEHVHPARRRP